MGSIECALFPRHAIISLCLVSFCLVGCACRRQLTSECDVRVYCKWINRLAVVVDVSVSRNEELQA